MPEEHEAVRAAGVPESVESLIDAATDAERAGDYAFARDRYEEAIGSLRVPEHAPIAASLLRWIGSTYRDEGKSEAAFDCYAASLAVAEANEDRLNTAHAYNCIAVMEWRWGHLDEAIDNFTAARELAGGIRGDRLVSMIEQNLGVIETIRGDRKAAMRRYRAALAGYRKMGDERYLGPLLNNLGMLHVEMEEWKEAAENFDKAAAASERAGDFDARIMVETNRAMLHIRRRQFETAREHCGAAFELATRYNHQLGLGETHKAFGIVDRETGRSAQAETHLVKATEIAERFSSPLLAAESQRELAQLYRTLDRNRQALNSLNYAHRVFTDLSARPDLADIDRRIAELEKIFLEIVRKWGESIESKDDYTAGHCDRVAEYSLMLARGIGFDKQTLIWFRMGAFLHDVGKTMVPPSVLNKKGELNEAEWEIMRGHTIIGEDLLAAIDFPWDVRPMIRSHHERWDGTGYPDQLSGRSIPLSARVLCIADIFDALTTTRSYRAAYSPQKALDIMEKDSGTILDPELFAIFRTLIEARLNEGELWSGERRARSDGSQATETEESYELSGGAGEVEI